MDEPTLVYSDMRRGWIFTQCIKIWFFENTNVVCMEYFSKNFFGTEHHIRTFGGTIEHRQEASEFLNEFCEVAEEDY